MRAKTMSVGVVGVAMLVVAAGCGASSSATSPTPFGTSAASAVSALSSPEVTIFNVEAAGTPADGRGPCMFEPGSGRFGCDNMRRDGLDFSRTVTFYDANGAVQTAYDANTTASIKTETSAKGTTKTKDGTATINRTGLMVVTGLAGAETSRTLNGNEQGTVAFTGTDRNGASVSSNTSVSDTTNNMVVPVSGGRNTARGYPLSGSRTHSTSTTTTRGTETKTETLVRKETFDGTNIVQVDLTINGVTQHCTNDLATHKSTCQR